MKSITHLGCLFLFCISACIPSAQAVTAVQHFQGPGGLAVYLVESHTNPMVEMRLLARGGSAFDPPHKAGVAALTAWMFNEGGGEMDAATFQERLAFHGISLGASVERDSMAIHLSTLTDQLDEAWARLADAILRPRFDAADFARARADQTAGIVKNRERPDKQASLLLRRHLYPNHPYGQPILGTVASVARVLLDDVKRFHADTFHAPEMVLAVAGDIDAARLQAALNHHLAALDATPSPFATIAQAQPVAQGQTHQAMEVPQTSLRLGTIGIGRNDPDYYAFYVVNQILGGHGLSSRLNEEIREKRGLAYSVYSSFAPAEGGGPFTVGMKTKTASTHEALSLIRQEIQRMATEGVSEEALQNAKRYLTGSFPLYLDGLGKLADIWSLIGFYKRGMDYLDRWPSRIRAVSREACARVARRVLDLSHFHTVTVGRP